MFTKSTGTGSGIEAANMSSGMLSWVALELPLVTDSGAPGLLE